MAVLTRFAAQVLGTVRKHGLLCAGDRVVVAVSGGPDSMALLEALAEAREELGLSLHVAHLNHGLRGRAAEADAEFVAARAKELGLPLSLGRADVAAERRARGGSVESAGRRARYEFLGRVAAEVGAGKVAVGHTTDDQVETILVGLLRGGELKALCGMPAARPLAARRNGEGEAGGNDECRMTNDESMTNDEGRRGKERGVGGRGLGVGGRGSGAVGVAGGNDECRRGSGKAGEGRGNDECRMPNDESMTNDEGRMPESERTPDSSPDSHSSFVIRHSSLPSTLLPRPSTLLVRPLLERTRAEVLAYLAARGVGFRVDESNADVAFERNLVRHELLPLLEARCGQGVRGMLLRLVRPARELVSIVEREAGRLNDECRMGKEKGVGGQGLGVGGDGKGNDECRMGKGEARLRVESVRARPALVRRAAARQAFARAGGAGELTRRAVDAVEALLGGGSGREAALGGGVVARRSYGEVRFGKGERGAPPRIELVLAVPGRVELPEVGLWVEAQVVNAECRMPNDELDCRLPIADCRLQMPRAGNGSGERIRRPWEEVVDLEKTGERLVVRTRRPGDRFVPLGLAAPKKLKDFFVDERVPREERERVLVVEGRSGIAWVVGLRLDERAKVGPQTRRFARLRAGTLEGGG